MYSNDEKKLFSTYKQTMDKFWSHVYYPHIANNHVCMNLNKQVIVHFFYQTILNCNENIEHILEHTTVNTDTNGTDSDSSYGKTKVVFTNRIAKELPMCTVAVDHEDNDLISYNRQCLHPYYASIRLLCQHSSSYTREMSTHSNFQWAFKHIMPYSNQYSNAVQELNKCVQLFIHQEVPTPKKSKNKKKTSINKKQSGESSVADEEVNNESEE